MSAAKTYFGGAEVAEFPSDLAPVIDPDVQVVVVLGADSAFPDRAT